MPAPFDRGRLGGVDSSLNQGDTDDQENSSHYRRNHSDPRRDRDVRIARKESPGGRIREFSPVTSRRNTLTVLLPPRRPEVAASTATQEPGHDSDSCLFGSRPRTSAIFNDTPLKEANERTGRGLAEVGCYPTESHFLAKPFTSDLLVEVIRNAGLQHTSRDRSC